MSAWIVVAIVVLHVTVLGAPAAHRDQNSTSVPRCVAQCDDDNSHAAILGDILDEVSYCDGGFSTGPLRPHVDWVSAKCIRWRRNDDGKRVLVGQGSFGKVYLARFGADDVAVKKFKEQHSCRHELEASIACKDIPGIIPFLGITPLDDRQYGLVTLLAKHGTLRHIIHSSDVSSECLLQLMIDVCSGVAALHSLGIVHGDLTPTNIFVRDSLSGPKALIGDLGTAVCLKRHQPIPDRCFFQTVIEQNVVDAAYSATDFCASAVYRELCSTRAAGGGSEAPLRDRKCVLGSASGYLVPCRHPYRDPHSQDVVAVPS